MVASADILQPATAAVVGAVAVAGIIFQRSYETFDIVLAAVENSTVEIVEAVTHETTKAIPIFMGIVVTLILLFLRVLVQKYWTSRKETMKKCGESPEGNAALGDADTARSYGEDHPYPFLPWLNRDVIARATRNLPDAMVLAIRSVRRKRDTLMSFNFEVDSQNVGGKKYVVRIAKGACLPSSATKPLRDLVSCGCPGHAVVLANSGEDDVCKHCGAVLLCCVTCHRPPTSVSLALSPVTDVPPLQVANRTPFGPIQGPEHFVRYISSTRTLADQVSREPAPRARSPVRRRAIAALSQKYDPRVRPVLALEDAQPSEPGLEPAAGAVTPEDAESSTGSILAGYDESAEEAADIMINGGKLLSVMSAKQAQKMAAFLLGRVKERAILTAFTLDLLVLCSALSAAAQLSGVRVQVYVDKSHSLKGSTSAQMDRLQLLRRSGVEVYLAHGVSSGGIQHSKSLLVDSHYICGSTNWTTSSRSNHESTLLVELTGEGKAAVMTKLGYIMQTAELLTIEAAEASQEWRKARAKSRGRSVEADLYTTARRFSLARARSREAALGV